jgi:hypothetical protein
MKTFWMSWYDFDPNITETAATFRLWITGVSDGDAETMCACVDAETQEQAWKKVEAVFPHARTRIRFIVEHEFGWSPDPGRFP